MVLSVTAGGTLLLLLAIVAYLWMPAVGSPSADALRYSLSAEVGAYVPSEEISSCASRSEVLWRCEVPDTGASGTATYRVLLDGRCWKARKVESLEEGPRLKPVAAGCVDLRDQLRLWERLF